MNSDFFAKILIAFSYERLRPYNTDNSSELIALSRYLWNIAVCESFYSTLQMAEVTLRNGIHRELTEKCGTPFWFDEVFLTDWGKNKVFEARKKLMKIRKFQVPGSIVAELDFGFWTSFFNHIYERNGLTHYILKTVLKTERKYRTSKIQQQRWDEIRKLRNRVFHHERIIHWKDLPQKHDRLLETIGWISPETKELTLKLDTFPIIYSNNIDPWIDKIQRYWPKNR